MAPATCTSVLVVVTLFCWAVTLAATDRFCMSTGVQLANNVTSMNIITMVSDFNRINRVSCPGGDMCFECYQQSLGAMSYGASCASRVKEAHGMTCNEQGLEPCSSTTDTKCHPKLASIRGLKKCRYSVNANMIIKLGNGDIYCNDTCSSAAAMENENDDEPIMYIGCTSNCLTWLSDYKKTQPKAVTKFCEGARLCFIKNHTNLASDDISDDDSGGSSIIITSRAAVLGLAAAIICLGLRF